MQIENTPVGVLGQVGAMGSTYSIYNTPRQSSDVVDPGDGGGESGGTSNTLMIGGIAVAVVLGVGAAVMLTSKK